MLTFWAACARHALSYVVGWRSVFISRPATLRRERAALVVEQENVARVPFEDIAVVVLDHRDITLTHAVLATCADHGIALFCTGEQHHPSGVLLPFLTHSRSTQLLRAQLDLARPRAKRAWASIVRTKIENQAACLRLSGSGGADRLASYARRMRSGDPENLEAQAGAYYFPQLFGRGFTRSSDCAANGALNYGYAVMRAAVARGLVAHGMHPSVGLHHASEQNAFNLADDLLEPLRPLVDLHVRSSEFDANAPGDLAAADKTALVALLNVDLAMPRGTMSVLSAVEQSVESLARFVGGRGDTEDLELPRLLGLTAHRADDG
jgi:CRISPR-associated protein Cas1